VQNKKRNKKRGLATFSGRAAPFFRKEEKAGGKNGACPHFPKKQNMQPHDWTEYDKKAACLLYYALLRV
jgi:hypothetical protein